MSQQTRGPAGQNKVSFELITAARKAMLRNGFTPLPNVDKQCFLNGWSTIAVTDAVIDSWETEYSEIPPAPAPAFKMVCWSSILTSMMS